MKLKCLSSAERIRFVCGLEDCDCVVFVYLQDHAKKGRKDALESGASKRTFFARYCIVSPPVQCIVS